MKRSIAALTGLLLLGLPAVATPSSIVFSYTIASYPEDTIIESLMDGHRSEVRYEIRVYRKSRGVRRIFGNKLIKQVETVYVARWDALNERYIVLVDDVGEVTFDDKEVFLSFFLSLSGHNVPIPVELEDDDYLVCRSRIQPIKLVPPLTLMTLIRPELMVVSSWNQIAFERAIQ